MRNAVLILAATLLAGCSSSAPTGDTTPSTAPAQAEKPKVSAPARKFTPAKPVKCKYDTDCIVQDSCVSGKCKLAGNDCRFRSDCPSPRGTCVSNICEFY